MSSQGSASSQPAAPSLTPMSLGVPSTLDAGDALFATTDVTILPRVPGYTLLHEIGRGGMGVVYKAQRLISGQIVAVKMLRDGALAGIDHLARFRGEAEALTSLDHPHFLRLLEIGQYEGRPFLVLQFAGGGNLAQRLVSGISPDDAAALVETLARAVQHAHDQGIVHRDLKPANILLTEDGIPLIADFGLAKYMGGHGLTLTGDVFGTPNYMAPEQAEGRNEDVTPVTDIYSLGAVLYECLTGHPPFRGMTTFATLEQVRTQDPLPPRMARPEIHPDLEAICLKCLRKKSGQRYPSAAALASELRLYLSGTPLQQTDPGGKAFEHHCRPLIRRATEEAQHALAAGDLLGALPWLAQVLHLEPFGLDGEVHRLRIWAVLRRCPRVLGVWSFSTAITRVAMASEGKVAAVLNENGRVLLIDISDGQLSSELNHPGHVQCMAFRGDGTRLVTGGDDGHARIWEPITGRLLGKPLPLRQWITWAGFSDDGKLLITGGMRGSTRLWEVSTGEAVGEAFEAEAMVWSACLSPDNARLAVASLDGTVRFWDVLTGKPLGRVIRHREMVGQIRFHPDGCRLVTVSEHSIRTWEVASGEGLLSLQPGEPTRDAWFSPDGKRVLASNVNGTVRVWDAQTGAVLAARVPAGVLGRHPLRTVDGRRELRFDPQGAVWLLDHSNTPPYLPLEVTESARNAAVGRVEVRQDRQLELEIKQHSLSVRVPDSPAMVLPPWDMPVGTTAAGFDPTGQRVLVLRGDGMPPLRWDFTVDRRPTEDVTQLCQMLSARRAGNNGLEQHLGGDLLAGWTALRSRYPADFRVVREESLNWHEEAARICQQFQFPEDQLRHLTAMIELTPNNPATWDRRGRLYAEQRQWERAASDFTEVAHRTNQPENWQRCARAWESAGRWEAALPALTRVAEGRPNHWEGWYRLGHARLKTGDAAQAVTDLSRAIKLRPNDRACLGERGQALGQLSRWAEAVADLQMALALGDHQPETCYLLALIQLRLSNLPAYKLLCRSLFGQATEDAPVTAHGWAAWTGILHHRGVNPAVILRSVQRVHKAPDELCPSLRPFCRTLVGGALLRARRYPEAQRFLRTREANAWDWLFLSLLSKLKREPLANEWRERAEDWMTSPEAQQLSWYRRLELSILCEQTQFAEGDS